MDLTREIKNGNPIAFERAFYNWQSKVYTYFLRRTQDSEFAQELTQLTFIRLWDFHHTLSFDYSLDTQVFRIARTTMIDCIRERERRKKLEQAPRAEKAEPSYSPYSLSPSKTEIAGALNTLPPIRKKVFVLNRFHGYSYKEIATELSISDRTVEKHISLALKQLKKLLAIFSLLLLYFL